MAEQCAGTWQPPTAWPVFGDAHKAPCSVCGAKVVCYQRYYDHGHELRAIYVAAHCQPMKGDAMSVKEKINVSQPPLGLGAQKALYDALTVLNSARQAHYFEKPLQPEERSELCALLNAGWTLYSPEGVWVSTRVDEDGDLV